MSQSSKKIEWCHVRLGEDLNWWVSEVSDPIHWDVDGLGIIDPRQMSYILEQCDTLRDYGLDADLLDEAFFSMRIGEEIEDQQLILKRTPESLLEDENMLFALPDIIDEEKGPFADFLDHITKARVKLLNELIEFDQNLTVDELEEEIRERMNQDYMEGKAVHPYSEITAILDYVPNGYELDEDERPDRDKEDIDDIPDFEEDETLEEDETMKWDEEEEEEDEDDEDSDSDSDDEDEDKESDDEGKDDRR